MKKKTLKIKLPYLKNLKIKLPTIALLETYTKDSLFHNKVIYISVFIASPFTIARRWKQPICPTVNVLIVKMWYTLTMNEYSIVKRNKIVGKLMEKLVQVR